METDMMSGRISVCMASYNGAAYIREQIDSILVNLSEGDELIISDDGSKDETRDIVHEYEEKDSRVRLVDGPHAGVIANFENAIKEASGDYIYLTDQDDLWAPDKVAKVQKVFAKKENCYVVLHDTYIVDKDNNIVDESFFAMHGSKTGMLNNIIRNSYIGCCMAFRKELLDVVLPIPKNIEMHDQWIGVWGDIKGKNYMLKKPLLRYRRHGNNVSSFKHYGVMKMIRNRVVFVWNLLKRKCGK